RQLFAGLSVRREPACEGESACRLPTKTLRNRSPLLRRKRATVKERPVAKGRAQRVFLCILLRCIIATCSFVLMIGSLFQKSGNDIMRKSCEGFCSAYYLAYLY